MIEKRDPLNLTGKVAVVTGGGSGIGLALADEIVAMHSGELDIESQEGVGTVVTIRLPALHQELPETPLQGGNNDTHGEKK